MTCAYSTCTQVDQYEVGDLVALIGERWPEDMKDTVIRVVEIDPNGHGMVQMDGTTSEGSRFHIYVHDKYDWSAELVMRVERESEA